MKKDMFRKEAVEKITDPDDLNMYIKVLSPRVWFLLAGIGISIIGIVVFLISTGFPVGDLFFG